MKKLLLFATTLLLSAGLLACSSDAPVTTTEATRQPPPDPVTVVENGECAYRIVRGQRSSDEVRGAMLTLRRAIIEKFGVTPDISNDLVLDEAELTADNPEILIGDTNRPESAALKETLPAGNSYAIAVMGKRIVIVASSDVVLAKAVDIFIESYIQTAEGGSLMLQGDLSITKTLTDFVRKGWVLSCPSPMTGILSEGYYNAGSGLADDVRKESKEYSRMQLISNVDSGEFAAYCDAMQAAGYKALFRNTVGKNEFAGFTKDGLHYHVAYLKSAKELRVTEDRAGVSVADFAYDTTGDTDTVLYQYGLYYDPNNQVTNKTVNCGMLYIVRLSDNSLVLVDGGHLHQASEEAMEGLIAFLHEITGTNAGDTIRIAAWYMTHAHGDHVTVMAKLCNRYHDEIALERVMYNIPSYQVRSSGYDENTTTVKSMIRKYYPEAKFLKLHTGQQFSLSDVGVEVLYTHEDAVGTKQFEAAPDNGGVVKLDISDYNSSSTVLRLTIDGKTVILLGDISTEAENVMKKNFPASVWKSDAVQVAHHCFNYLNSLYPMIAAPLALMPNSYFGSHTPENLPKLQTVLDYVENDQIYYEGSATYGFAVVDGKLTMIYEAPLIGGEYDFSGI